jgi:hypothetical protein
MKKITWLSFFFSASLLVAGTYPDVGYEPPESWTDPKFVLSQDYPQSLPPDENYPWTKIDFKQHPQDYLEAVIKYCYEGNLEAEFVPQKNTKRHWYHAPWLHYGPNQREFVHGLTGERNSRPFELSATQSDRYRNVAVGFYNDKGGYALGKFWHDPAAPNIKGVSFPEGTVTFKLLFTTALPAKVPYLVNSPEWVADLDHSQNVATIKGTKVRLLQIDIAVKDARSSCGGWMFGTFHYDNATAGKTPWEKLRPLTLLWGDDPTLTQAMANGGTKPKESWVNSASPIVKYRKNATASGAPKTLGWAGRGNGPVDNPISSCLSCHSTAQSPVKTPILPSGSDTDKLRWFRNLAPNEAFDAGSESFDFSQQLSAGLQNFKAFNKVASTQGGISNEGPAPVPPAIRPLTTPATAATPAATPEKEFKVTRDPEG